MHQGAGPGVCHLNSGQRGVAAAPPTSRPVPAFVQPLGTRYGCMLRASSRVLLSPTSRKSVQLLRYVRIYNNCVLLVCNWNAVMHKLCRPFVVVVLMTTPSDCSLVVNPPTLNIKLVMHTKQLGRFI